MVETVQPQHMLGATVGCPCGRAGTVDAVRGRDLQYWVEIRHYWLTEPHQVGWPDAAGLTRIEGVDEPAGPRPPAGGRNGRWVRLGDVGVDSAHLAVLDPGYVRKKLAPSTLGGDKLWGQLPDDVGLEFMAGFGDGTYDVWGWIVDYGDEDDPDERVAQIVVTLVDNRELQEWRRA